MDRKKEEQMGQLKFEAEQEALARIIVEDGKERVREQCKQQLKYLDSINQSTAAKPGPGVYDPANSFRVGFEKGKQAGYLEVLQVVIDALRAR